MGGYEKVFEKLKAFAHQEVVSKELNKENLKQSFIEGNYMGFDINKNIINIDDSFPKYLINNQDKFKHLIK